MATNGKNIQLTDEQLQLLGELATKTGQSQEAILSNALRQYRAPPADTGENGGHFETVYDVLERNGLIGCVKGGPPDLSTNPKYMEGFGESDY
jgi:hypothetical protein